MPKNAKPVAVDLYCGAGGMSLGFERAGFEVRAAFDANPRCVETHKTNFPRCNAVLADLARENGASLRRLGGLGRTHIDVLFGGPPCGGFSLAGQRDPRDPRNKLLIRFAELVGELRPSYFVVENVRGLQIGAAVRVLERFRRVVRKAGYIVVWPARVLDAANYGVPQKRERIFILGCKAGLPVPEYPTARTPVARGERPTVGDAINDLALIDDNRSRLAGDEYRGPLGPPSAYAKRLLAGAEGQRRRDLHSRRRHFRLTGCLRVKHSSAAKHRFRTTRPGKREQIGRFFRLDNDKQAPTLRAGTDLEHGKFTAVRPIHPDFPRCITVREAARLHSFPDWFQFHPTKWHGFMQIGNSVPPLLARAVARSILAAKRTRPPSRCKKVCDGKKKDKGRRR